MPVLDPHPQDGQRKLLMVFGVILGILVLIGVVATLAAP
ncbi:SGM_5486 family transporter-associated protein [Streptomyces sp. Z26]|nr:SGM_5486 family transporter-associated protein [Streptomyces sp. Z26]